MFIYLFIYFIHLPIGSHDSQIFNSSFVFILFYIGCFIIAVIFNFVFVFVDTAVCTPHTDPANSEHPRIS